MILQYARIIQSDDTLEFGYKEGQMTVEVKMPRAKLAAWLSNYQSTGTLHELVTMYINHMMNLGDLLS